MKEGDILKNTDRSFLIAFSKISSLILFILSFIGIIAGLVLKDGEPLTVVCVFLFVIFGLCLTFSCIKESINYKFNEMNIQKFYGERVVKTIAYDQIKCIAVEWALYSNGRYREIVKDTDGRQKAALILYRIKEPSFWYGLGRHSCSVIHTENKEQLCSIVLDEMNIEKVLLKTNLEIYILDNIVNEHFGMLQSFLVKYPKRFILIVCNEKGTCQRRLTYDKYLEMQTMNTSV